MRSGGAVTAVPVRLIQEREVRHSVDGIAHQNLLYAWSLDGGLSAARVREAVARIAERHEALRTSFRTAGHQVVGVLEPHIALPWTALELRRLAPERRSSALDAALLQLVREPFELASAPLWRALLARLDGSMSVLALAVAHIVWDARSTTSFVRELQALCGRKGEPPELPIQLADFAAWERRSTRDAGATCAGAATARRFEPAERRFTAASAETAAALRSLARRQSTTPSTVVLAGFVALLQGSGVTVAVLDANRDRPELRDLIGYLPTAATLKVSADASLSFGELLRIVHGRVAAAYADEPRRVPPGDVMFNFVPAAIEPGVGSLRPYETPLDWVRFPACSTPWGVELELELFDRRTGALDAILSCDPHAIDADAARRFASGFSRLLERVAHEPEVAVGTLTCARLL